MSAPPPPRLPAKLPIHALTPRRVYRVFELGYAARYFSRDSNNRFTVKRDGVLYASNQPFGAYIETLPLIWRPDRTCVGPTELWLAKHGMATLDITRTLRLVNLTAGSLGNIGLDNRISTGDYAYCQQWAETFHAHPDRIDGLRYRARHDPSQISIAIFERAAPAVTFIEAAALGADLELQDKLLDHFRHQILPD